MARVNEILAGRFNRALQKFLSMKGGPPAAQLASEIGAMFVFNRMGADFRYLESWNRYGVTFTIGGVALNQGTFRLRNPLGSNVIAVVEKLNFIGQAGIATNTQISVQTGGQPTPNDLASVATTQNSQFDPRGSQGATIIPSSEASSVSPPALINANLFFQGETSPGSNLDMIVPETQKLPILPASRIHPFSTHLNSTLLLN